MTGRPIRAAQPVSLLLALVLVGLLSGGAPPERPPHGWEAYAPLSDGERVLSYRDEVVPPPPIEHKEIQVIR